MHKYLLLFFLCALCVFARDTFSQSSLYMPLDIKHAYDNGTRSYDGKPGPNYWQNRSEYKIKVSIEPGTRLLSGDETITYYNNSPDTLKELVIRLYQDINKPGAPRDFQLPEEALTSGVEIQKLTLNGALVDLDDKTKAERNGTNLTLHLPEISGPIPPHSNTEITASWNFTIPKGSSIRMGTYDSTTFFVAYWYPQVSVYDDVHGWDKITYAGLLEFYNDFNDYDVEISVPPGYCVWSTGVLQNPEEVYSPETLARYNLALQSDSVIHIITEDDLLNGNITNDLRGAEQLVPPRRERSNPLNQDNDLRGAERHDNPINETNNLTWKVKADYVPDFAFAVSNSWLWDACSIDLSSPTSGGLQLHLPFAKVEDPAFSGRETQRGSRLPLSKGEIQRGSKKLRTKNYELRTNNRTLISAVYNKSSLDMYSVAEMSRLTIDFYSRTFPGVPYPYPRMTVFNGSGGMEFPMMVNEGASEERIWTVYVITHEIAHTYFPFYMGINERKYAWMDEGWAQNFSERAQKLIDPGLDQQARNVFRFLNYSGNETDVPMVITSDNVHNSPSYGNSSYFRPCNAYNFLEDALGHELFMKALHEYIARWHGKHPIPYDFFFTFENTLNPPLKGARGMTRQDLSWFFNPWFFEEGYPDLAITDVSTRAGTVKITVEKLGNLPVPIYITAKTSAGDSITLSESCSVWRDGKKETVLEIKTNKTIKSIYLGNSYIPDAVIDNNTFIIK